MDSDSFPILAGHDEYRVSHGLSGKSGPGGPENKGNLFLVLASYDDLGYLTVETGVRTSGKSPQCIGINPVVLDSAIQDLQKIRISFFHTVNLSARIYKIELLYLPFL